MATKMLTKGAVQFNGQTIQLGWPVLVDGREGRVMLAWVRDGVTPDGTQSQPSVTIRVKWITKLTDMPSDFCDVAGERVIIEQAAPLEQEAA